MLASDCFDFTYAENVQACVDLLDRRRLDDGAGEEINIDRVDGLIDLSPVVGHYLEAVFFDRYNPTLEVILNPKPIAKQLRGKLTDDPWHNSLLLTAVDTDQMRYAEQVTRKVSGEEPCATTSSCGTWSRTCRSSRSCKVTRSPTTTAALTPMSVTASTSRPCRWSVSGRYADVVAALFLCLVWMIHRLVGSVCRRRALLLT